MVTVVGTARQLLDSARALDSSGHLVRAMVDYRAAIEAGESERNFPILAEALRRLGVIHHRQGQSEVGSELCDRSLKVASEAGLAVLAAEALNALANIDLDRGQLARAEEKYRAALEQAGASLELRGRVMQNLGILANIRGDYLEAERNYRGSLDAFIKSQNLKGCAIAYNNLGMISADHRKWNEAEWYFGLGLAAAQKVDDAYLQGLCLLNHADVPIAQQRFHDARTLVEEALRIFERLGAQMDKAAAYRQLGVIYRETGASVLAEARFVAALDLAVTTGSALIEAETAREMAILYQVMNRNQESLKLLNRSYRLFRGLDARVDLVDVEGKVRKLEGTYLLVVHNWGQSIESADSYTFGHCSRVADYALAVAQQLGLSEDTLTAVRLGAYLHDVGKVKIPHEILNKPGRLTPEEFEIIKLHPVYGVELLEGIEFPWDIKPIIRSHHEKYDGTGYPDGLAGDAIPLEAQIICIVDVYDALTTTRSYRGALPKSEALERMRASITWWRPDVFDAFMRTVGRDAEVTAPTRETAAA